MCCVQSSYRIAEVLQNSILHAGWLPAPDDTCAAEGFTLRPDSCKHLLQDQHLRPQNCECMHTNQRTHQLVKLHTDTMFELLIQQLSEHAGLLQPDWVICY